MENQKLAIVGPRHTNTKVCSWCGMELELSMFHRNKETKTGLASQCKNCNKLATKRYREAHRDKERIRSCLYKRDLSKFISTMYSRIRARALGKVDSRHKKYYKNITICSREDFVDFCMKDNELHGMYITWQNASHEMRLTPTVDRINSKLGYTLDNIQFLTHSDNSRKAHKERRYDETH